MSADDNVTAEGNGEVVTTSIVNDKMLGEIQSFDDALAIVNEAFGGEIIETDKVMGTGFGVAEDKASYIGVPMIVIKAEKNPSEKGEKGRFWSCHAVTKDGRKVILNDGGTGIADQFDALSENHPEWFTVEATESGFRRFSLAKPMLVKRGLRRSDYNHPTAGPSTTYYLDTSGTV